MLNEIAFTPEVFNHESYSSMEVANLKFEDIAEQLVTDSLVRDLFSGGWSRTIKSNVRSLPSKYSTILKALKKKNRLIPIESQSEELPTDEIQWIKEAIKSFEKIGFSGLMVTNKTIEEKHIPWSSIENFKSSDWWKYCIKKSRRLHRKKEEYLANLALLLRHSRALHFIDPHIAPNNPNYSNFIDLLLACKRQIGEPGVIIQIHRICRTSTDRKGTVLKVEWEDVFKEWKSQLNSAGVKVEVYVWDDFHDRYLISNYMGLSVPNGFDTSATKRTTWTKLSRDDADDVRREFSEGSSEHKLHHKFCINDL